MVYVNTMTDNRKAEVEAGAQWAIALAGCQETPVRCGSCGAVYSVEIAAIPGTQEAEPASMCEQLAGENHNIRNSER